MDWQTKTDSVWHSHFLGCVNWKCGYSFNIHCPSVEDPLSSAHKQSWSSYRQYHRTGQILPIQLISYCQAQRPVHLAISRMEEFAKHSVWAHFDDHMNCLSVVDHNRRKKKILRTVLFANERRKKKQWMEGGVWALDGIGHHIWICTRIYVIHIMYIYFIA